MIYKFGAIPDQEDGRDAMLPRSSVLPPASCILQMPPALDQGTVNACVPSASDILLQYLLMNGKVASKPFLPSIQYTYYNARIQSGNLSRDAGTNPRSCFKGMKLCGVCDEALWPLSPSTVTQKPSQACYTDGAKHKQFNYYAILQTELAMKQCIAAGYPFSFCLPVYEGLLDSALATGATSILPLPASGEKSFGTSHALVAYGFDDTYWYLRNSWGSGWCDNGGCRTPLSYLTNPVLVNSLWTLRGANA